MEWGFGDVVRFRGESRDAMVLGKAMRNGIYVETYQHSFDEGWYVLVYLTPPSKGAAWTRCAPGHALRSKES